MTSTKSWPLSTSGPLKVNHRLHIKITTVISSKRQNQTTINNSKTVKTIKTIKTVRINSLTKRQPQLTIWSFTRRSDKPIMTNWTPKTANTNSKITKRDTMHMLKTKHCNTVNRLSHHFLPKISPKQQQHSLQSYTRRV